MELCKATKARAARGPFLLSTTTRFRGDLGQRALRTWSIGMVVDARERGR
jgi:hypothetical protein